MNSRIFWQSDWPFSNTVRWIVQRSTRYSQHFLSAVGLIALTSLLALWLRPQWRDPFATRLLPFFTIVSELNPTLEPDANQDLDNPILASSSNTSSVSGLTTSEAILGPTPLSLSTLVRSMSSERVDAAARDDRILSSEHDQALIARYLARRYRVAHDPLQQIVRVAFETGRETGLDPLLLLAVMAVESSFNPFAESGVGAQGLMQVMSSLHAEKFNNFGGPIAALDPFSNIKVGAIVLRNYIVSTGSLKAGLRRYVGSSARGDGGYGARVLSERTRLREVIYAEEPTIKVAKPSTRSKARKTARSSTRSQTIAKTTAMRG